MRVKGWEISACIVVYLILLSKRRSRTPGCPSVQRYPLLPFPENQSCFLSAGGWQNGGLVWRAGHCLYRLSAFSLCLHSHSQNCLEVPVPEPSGDSGVSGRLVFLPASLVFCFLGLLSQLLLLFLIGSSFPIFCGIVLHYHPVHFVCFKKIPLM